MDYEDLALIAQAARKTAQRIRDVTAKVVEEGGGPEALGMRGFTQAQESRALDWETFAGFLMDGDPR